MKKTTKKLALATETLRSLSPEELGDVGGATQLGQIVYLASLSNCGCPTQDWICVGTINTIGISRYIRY